MSFSMTVSDWGEKMAVSDWGDDKIPLIETTKSLGHIRANSGSTVPKPSRSRSDSYLTVSSVQHIGIPRTFTPRLNVPPAQPPQGLVHDSQTLDSCLRPGLTRTSSNYSWRSDNTISAELENDSPAGAKQRPVSCPPPPPERRDSLPEPLSIHALSPPMWCPETVQPLPDDTPTPEVRKKPRPKSYLSLVTPERPKYTKDSRHSALLVPSTLSTPHKRSSSLFSFDRLLASVSPKQPRCTSYSSMQSTLIRPPRHPESLKSPASSTPDFSSYDTPINDRKASSTSRKTSSSREPYVYPSYQPQPDPLYLSQLAKDGHGLPFMPNRIPCPREQNIARGYHLNKQPHRPSETSTKVTLNKKEKERKDKKLHGEEEQGKAALLSPFIPYYEWTRSLPPSHPLSVPPSPTSSCSSSDIKLVYNIRTNKFRLESQSTLVRNSSSITLKDLSLPEVAYEQEENKESQSIGFYNDMPPLLCDGRMVIVPLKDNVKVDRLVLHWRSFDGISTQLRVREVVFPNHVLMGVSLGKFEEMFVECV
ncbi:hypothetical protein BDZ45DRAFT_237343 [Acephala macrosclerotiorum]|nr:hypothetical protein BDZ45DRAFT_237343 [Acephala macrosclerotiorum]